MRIAIHLLPGGHVSRYLSGPPDDPTLMEHDTALAYRLQCQASMKAQPPEPLPIDPDFDPLALILGLD